VQVRAGWCAGQTESDPMSAPSTDLPPAVRGVPAALESGDWARVKRMLDRAWPSLVDEHPDALRSALGALIERLQYPAAPEVTLDAVRSLSPRERKVLAELTTGDTIGTIADRLFVSRNTIKSQLHSAYRKLGVRTRAEAERAAVRHGITPETV